MLISEVASGKTKLGHSLKCLFCLFALIVLLDNLKTTRFIDYTIYMMHSLSLSASISVPL